MDLCRVWDVCARMDSHQGQAAYLQAILTVGVAAATGAFAIFETRARRRGAERRWKAHLASIAALVQFADNEIARIVEQIGGKEWVRENIAPESRYLDHSLLLLKAFNVQSLPSEDALRAWFDMRWYGARFTEAIRQTWANEWKIAGGGSALPDTVAPAAARQFAAEFQAAAARVRKECAEVADKAPPLNVLSNIPDLIDAT